MKKVLLTILWVLAILMPSAAWAQSSEAYAVLSESNTKLTFYYDDQKDSRIGTTMTVTTGETRGWYSYMADITSVTFDGSFAIYTGLTSTDSWFNECTSLTSITGLANLNTDNVTNMSAMFRMCTSLTSIDFYNFTTASVTDMNNMFFGCSGLTSLDLSGFNTTNVADMHSMFAGCTGLTTLDLSNFNTASLTNMQGMFSGCSLLTEINLGSFNTASVTDVRYLFNACPKLITVYVGSNWSMSSVTDNGYGVFNNCTSIVGGEGTTYDASHIDHTYAHIDGGTSNPGYFTDIADYGKVKEAYAVLSDENTKLTFYYDKKKTDRSGMSVGPFVTSLGRAWNDNSSSITTVIFDSTFANNTTLTSTASWFGNFDNLTTITGIENLNTANVTDMSFMFDGCSSLTSLDVSGFNTSSVTDMSCMVRNCSGLTTLDLSGFNTVNVINMNSMFYGCSGLTSLDLSGFNTANLMDMNYMFYGCSGLTSLDLSDFNTHNVTSMLYLFYNCSSLTTIYAGSGWSTTATVTSSAYMFTGCTNLVGGMGTTYDADHIDASYAHIDGGTSNPGYLTDIADYGKEAYVVMVDNKLTFYYDKMKDSRMGTITTITTGEYHAWTNSSSNVTEVIFDESFANYTGLTSTAQWFWSLQALTTITNLNFLNTSNVINMSQMFGSCSGLLSLDLSNFNTSKATDISQLFTGCEKLTSLNLSNFDTSNVTDMNNLFRDCHGLTSIDLSSFNTTKVTDMWGMFMNCDHIKVIDISSFNTSNVTNMNYMFAQNDDSHELKTIYVGSGWSTESVSQSGNMFSCCYNLWGGRGSSYDAYRVLSLEYIKYAHIDGGFDNPGFFTEKDVPLPYTVLDGNVFTFYYDKQMDSRDGMIVGEFYNGTPWYNLSNVVTSVVFDESFANCTNLTTTSYWFREFSNLESITGLDILKTDNVVNMQGMFYTCEKIKELNVGSFNTSKVNNMRSMFWGCKSLKVLDLSSFNTANVTNISYMFCQCDSLKTIYVGNTWTIDAVNSGENTFLGSDKLVGGEGTTYDYNHVDYTYAHIDGGPDNPGYFTDIADMGKVNEAYAALDGTTLTFYYDKKKTDRNGMSVGPFTSSSERGWGSFDTVVFDDSFASYRPTSTAYWFSGLSVPIIGIDNLKTDSVTDMSYMFNGYANQTGLDLRSFNTENVKSMRAMFFNSGLTSIDVSGFNTKNVTDMYCMFNECVNLSSIDVRNFNTENVTNMYEMFGECSNLTSIDVSNFKTDKVKNMGGMFLYCINLTSLDVSGFKTDNVTYMSAMFLGCSGLTSLDVSAFKTDSVTNMVGMFGNCSNLVTIYAGDGWSTANVENSDQMFMGCTSLVGGMGTTYDENHIDAAYAHIDGGASNPGYFTPKGGYVEAPTFTWSADELTMTSGTDGATIYYTMMDATAGANVPTPTQYTAPVTVTSDVLITAYAEKDGMARSMTTVLDYPYTAWMGLISAIADAQNVVVSADGNDNVTAEQLDSLMFQISVAQGMYIARIDSAAAINQMTTDLVTLTETIRQLVNAENEPYVVLTDSNTVMTFYYDGQKTARGGIDINNTYISYGDTSPYGTATTAVFDVSFDAYRPTSTAYWFQNCKLLTTITGIEYLHTEDVTSMFRMFFGCSSLTSLDVSHFKTDNVTDMSWMFNGCSGLTNLDVSGFKTDNVTDMSYMFYDCFGLMNLDVSGFKTDNVTNMVEMFVDCSSLTSLNLSNFNTTNVTSMELMFANCSSLMSLDVSKFNTVNVTDMGYMFANCLGLTSLDVSSFNTANVTNMAAMFMNCTGLTTLDLSSFKTDSVAFMDNMFDDCTNLTTFYVGNEWSTASVKDSSSVFNNCTSLVGGQGTVYDANHVDASYAHIDGGPDNPGYFTRSGDAPYVAPEAYAVLSGDSITLTFYYDNQKESRGGISFLNGTDVNWPSSITSVTKVSFDESFVDFLPTSTSNWFAGFNNLTSIEGMEYLNTAHVTHMSGMFTSCYQLKNLDVSGFKTDNVTDMSYMFFQCSDLTSLDLSGFKTDNMTDMKGMFWDCSCLTSLDLRGFNTANVMDMSYMFFHCTSLATIYVGDGWTTASVTSDGGVNMFADCLYLVGGKGTAYDANHTDETYAHIDGGPSNPGYLTQALAMGDANGDGSINIADAVATVTNILGQPAEGNFYRYAADMNTDQVIDIFDVTLIVNAAFDAASPAPAMTRGSASNIMMEHISMTADADYIYLGIDQPERFTATQFDVTLPEGMELVDARLASATTDHQLSFVKRGNNEYRVIGLSMSNATFRSVNGQLMKLEVSRTAVDGDVKMSNVLFVTPTAMVMTSVDKCLNTAKAAGDSLYDLNGRKLDNSRQQLGKGIYIMNHKKVIIK